MGAGQAGIPVAVGDDDSATWLTALVPGGPGRDEAITSLHSLLLRATRAEVNRRAFRSQISGPELDDLALQAANDAVVGVLRQLGTFRGDSRFTTWAYKFAILEVSNKLGRHFWTRPQVALEDHQWDQLPARFGVSPEAAAESTDLFDAVRSAVEADLTERQREVFVAIVLDGVPLDALVVKLGANRNAIYKLMFDARRKIRAALVTNGYL